MAVFDAETADDVADAFAPQTDESDEAEPVVDAWLVRLADEVEVIRCGTCGVARNADLDRCPVCDADAGRLAPAMCSVVGPCSRAACGLAASG